MTASPSILEYHPDVSRDDLLAEISRLEDILKLIASMGDANYDAAVIAFGGIHHHSNGKRTREVLRSMMADEKLMAELRDGHAAYRERNREQLAAEEAARVQSIGEIVVRLESVSELVDTLDGWNNPHKRENETACKLIDGIVTDLKKHIPSN